MRVIVDDRPENREHIAGANTGVGPLRTLLIQGAEVVRAIAEFVAARR